MADGTAKRRKFSDRRTAHREVCDEYTKAVWAAAAAGVEGRAVKPDLRKLAEAADRLASASKALTRTP